MSVDSCFYVPLPCKCTEAAKGVLQPPQSSKIPLEEFLALADGDSIQKLEDVFVKRRAPIDGKYGRRGITALHLFVSKGRNRPAVAWLIEHGADVNAYSPAMNKTVLETSFRACETEEAFTIVKLLVESGANVDTPRSKHFQQSRGSFLGDAISAVRQYKEKVFWLLFTKFTWSDEEVHYAFRIGILYNCNEMCQKLILNYIPAGGPVQLTRGYTTPLHIAVACDNLPMATWLLSQANGVDVNGTDSTGDTAITGIDFYKAGKPPMLELLELCLKSGADVNISDPRNINVWFRAIEGSNRGLEAFKVLLAYRGTPDNINSVHPFQGGGRTMLMHAAQLGRRRAVEMLLGQGADSAIGDKTALMLAIEEQYREWTRSVKNPMFKLYPSDSIEQYLKYADIVRMIQTSRSLKRKVLLPGNSVPLAPTKSSRAPQI